MEEVALYLYCFCVDGSVHVERKKLMQKRDDKCLSKICEFGERMGSTILSERVALDGMRGLFIGTKRKQMQLLIGG